jgi:integrase/recombinase XerC
MHAPPETRRAGEMTAARQDIIEALPARFIAYLDAKPKTIQTYARALRQLFRYFAARGITRPRREDLLAFRDWLQAGHKPATIQSYISAARLFFQWTEQEGLYPNVAERVKGATIDKGYKRDYLTGEQVRAVMNSVNRDTLRGLRDYAVLALMVTGGLRTVEVSRADIGDLGAVGHRPALYIQGKGKDEKAEYVKLGAKAELAVRRYLQARGAAGRSAPLFASLSNNSAGERLSTRSISGIIKQRLRNAGYDSDRLTAHSLRHTAVTLSLLAGKRLEEVQQFARHASITTTQIYNHALDRARNSCGEAIEAAVF